MLLISANRVQNLPATAGPSLRVPTFTAARAVSSAASTCLRPPNSASKASAAFTESPGHWHRICKAN